MHPNGTPTQVLRHVEREHDHCCGNEHTCRTQEATLPWEPMHSFAFGRMGAVHCTGDTNRARSPNKWEGLWARTANVSDVGTDRGTVCHGHAMWRFGVPSSLSEMVTVGGGFGRGASLAARPLCRRRVRTAANFRFEHVTAQPPAAADPAAPPIPTPPRHRK